MKAFSGVLKKHFPPSLEPSPSLSLAPSPFLDSQAHILFSGKADIILAGFNGSFIPQALFSAVFYYFWQ